MWTDEIELKQMTGLSNTVPGHHRTADKHLYHSYRCRKDAWERCDIHANIQLAQNKRNKSAFYNYLRKKRQTQSARKSNCFISFVLSRVQGTFIFTDTNLQNKPSTMPEIIAQTWNSTGISEKTKFPSERNISLLWIHIQHTCKYLCVFIV